MGSHIQVYEKNTQLALKTCFLMSCWWKMKYLNKMFASEAPKGKHIAVGWGEETCSFILYCSHGLLFLSVLRTAGSIKDRHSSPLTNQNIPLSLPNSIPTPDIPEEV